MAQNKKPQLSDFDPNSQTFQRELGGMNESKEVNQIKPMMREELENQDEEKEEEEPEYYKQNNYYQSANKKKQEESFNTTMKRIVKTEDAEKLMVMNKEEMIKYYEEIIDKCHGCIYYQKDKVRQLKQQ